MLVLRGSKFYGSVRVIIAPTPLRSAPPLSLATAGVVVLTEKFVYAADSSNSILAPLFTCYHLLGFEIWWKTGKQVYRCTRTYWITLAYASVWSSFSIKTTVTLVLILTLFNHHYDHDHDHNEARSDADEILLCKRVAFKWSIIRYTAVVG